jgi:hypothetical protein
MARKTYTVCGLTFTDALDASKYARIVFCDTLATFGPADARTVKALAEWGRVHDAQKLELVRA